VFGRDIPGARERVAARLMRASEHMRLMHSGKQAIPHERALCRNDWTLLWRAREDSVVEDNVLLMTKYIAQAENRRSPTITHVARPILIVNQTIETDDKTRPMQAIVLSSSDR
jgi:hypothetical protein